jgi:hypothetical protein
MPKRKLIPEDERPSVALKILARKEALALGHSFRAWTENGNGTWTARCCQCWKVCTVIPSRMHLDGGMGGKALTERCDMAGMETNG